MTIYDITATIGDNLPVFGNERPTSDKVFRLANGAPYNFTKLHGSTHTGTHADMPSHFIQDGTTCDTISLDHFYGRSKVLRIATTNHITEKDLARHDIDAGDIVLLSVGQSKHMQCATLKQDFIALTPCAAEFLILKRVKTVGIDYLSVDPYKSTDFPVHKALLGNGITILEGLVLDHVPEGEYTLSALPLKVHDGDGSPVRAVLVKSDKEV